MPPPYFLHQDLTSTSNSIISLHNIFSVNSLQMSRSTTSRDLESPPSSNFFSLPSSSESAPPPRSKLLLFSLSLTFIFLVSLAAFYVVSGTDVLSGIDRSLSSDPVVMIMDRGLKAGVSKKGSLGSGIVMEPGSDYSWTNQKLSSRRSGFHFQPEKNWMNDPNGPMYYNGWYHFFYQYNPDGAVWGNIAWGHAVSKDLLNWLHLPLALVPDRPYDIDGVFTGSATVLPDGSIFMIYTGLFNTSTDVPTQVQNVAVPANLSDPFLIDWVKLDSINPAIIAPPGILPADFRDPTSAWFEPTDSTWRISIGSKDEKNSGIALIYSTTDFKRYTLLSGTLHAVDDVGMWECVDFYPVTTSGGATNRGLDGSVEPSRVVKHVLKASTADNMNDYYSIGTYDPTLNEWLPDEWGLDVGVGLRYDWGRFYASKTFYDDKKLRRILWGWVKEADSEAADISKGWASLQGIPRSVLFDVRTGNHLLTWPVEEVKGLRREENDFSGSKVGPGSTFEVSVGQAVQLDIEAEFEIDKESLVAMNGTDVTYECGRSGGAAQRGLLGPFGLLVLATEDLTEQTATYFYVSKKTDGSLLTHFCQDELRSSKSEETIREVVGHVVPVIKGESLTLRVLVDHSIVESFALGGRASATSRVYPTMAIFDEAQIFLFNNATGATITATSLKVWQMNSTSDSYFGFQSL